MPAHPPSLPTRLRRHRGLWMLAVAVMLIKLVAGTVCLTDGLATKIVSAPTTASQSAPAMTAVDADAADDTAGCALGEEGGCHCACAHTATLPMALMLSIARMTANVETTRIAARFAPSSHGSPIRPPIA